MLIWFAALSIAGTFLVFRDAALDYRLVALGAVLADPIDAAITGDRAGPMHTLAVTTGVLGAVMLSTTHRRRVRRRLLGLSIGVAAHLVLDGAWALTQTFWWPGYGTRFTDRLPVLARGLVVGLLAEGIGVAVAVWLYRRFGLADPRRRATFLRTGRLDRSII
jgi:hypothetical protein